MTRALRSLTIASLATFAATAWVTPTSVAAAPISAYELIADIGADLDSRNLQRTRGSDAVPQIVENTDATIVSDNLIDGDFGIFNDNDVTYSHNFLSWLTPPAGTYLTAVLTIEAYGVNGNNDAVLVDNFDIGDLTNGNQFATSAFTGGQLLASVQDGILNVTINKSNNDEISIASSRLDVRVRAAGGSRADLARSAWPRPSRLWVHRSPKRSSVASANSGNRRICGRGLLVPPVSFGPTEEPHGRQTDARPPQVCTSLTRGAGYRILQSGFTD